MNKAWSGEKTLGICLGASTISAVVLGKSGEKTVIEQTVILPHEGNPKAVFQDLIRRFEQVDLRVLITGRKFRHFINLPNITEPEAIEYALEYIETRGTRYDALVSAGGETFMVYRLDHRHKVAGISTGKQ